MLPKSNTLLLFLPLSIGGGIVYSRCISIATATTNSLTRVIAISVFLGLVIFGIYFVETKKARTLTACCIPVLFLYTILFLSHSVGAAIGAIVGYFIVQLSTAIIMHEKEMHTRKLVLVGMKQYLFYLIAGTIVGTLICIFSMRMSEWYIIATLCSAGFILALYISHLILHMFFYSTNSLLKNVLLITTFGIYFTVVFIRDRPYVFGLNILIITVLMQSVITYRKHLHKGKCCVRVVRHKR